MPEANKASGIPPSLDSLDRKIIAGLQGGFPLCERPFAAAAATLGLGEDGEEILLRRLCAMLQAGILTRFGPMFQIERIGGAFVLAAMRVPEERWEEIVASVNALSEVAHNYRRDHEFNLWFVLATETPQGIAAAIEHIEAETGLPVYPFPKEREYFVEMKLEARL
ncbi:MAG: Lrp/AsnC family transcriptional regulator [Betaproteobacteria bacterium]|nr:Lrp/AsnC family transcriptional regulator [Betaproteobacteria bacterium]